MSKIFSLVGRHIYLHQGEEFALQIVHKDKNEDIVNFESSDIISLLVKDMRGRNILVEKTAEFMSIDGEEAQIFKFLYEDYVSLPPGNYIYSISISTDDGYKGILLDKASFTVLKNPLGYSSDIESYNLNSREFSVSTSKLCCEFNHKRVKDTSDDDSLILFDKVQTNISGDLDESLILFSDMSIESKESDDTLIVF